MNRLRRKRDRKIRAVKTAKIVGCVYCALFSLRDQHETQNHVGIHVFWRSASRGRCQAGVMQPRQLLPVFIHAKRPLSQSLNHSLSNNLSLSLPSPSCSSSYPPSPLRPLLTHWIAIERYYFHRHSRPPRPSRHLRRAWRRLLRRLGQPSAPAQPAMLPAHPACSPLLQAR